jgi:hypothetical protein
VRYASSFVALLGSDDLRTLGYIGFRRNGLVQAGPM